MALFRCKYSCCITNQNGATTLTWCLSINIAEVKSTYHSTEWIVSEFMTSEGNRITNPKTKGASKVHSH